MNCLPAVCALEYVLKIKKKKLRCLLHHQNPAHKQSRCLLQHVALKPLSPSACLCTQEHKRKHGPCITLYHPALPCITKQPPCITIQPPCITIQPPCSSTIQPPCITIQPPCIIWHQFASPLLSLHPLASICTTLHHADEAPESGSHHHGRSHCYGSCGGGWVHGAAAASTPCHVPLPTKANGVG